MTDDKNGLRYVKLQGREWMGLRLIDVRLGDGMNVVTGGNEQGKTRILLALQALLGKKYWPEQPLSKDASKGELTIELGDGDERVAYIVKWSLTRRGGMRLAAVTEADGTPIKQPQEFLKKLCGEFLDPWEFMRMATSTSKTDRKQAVDIFRGLISVQCDCAEFVQTMGHATVAAVQTLLTQHRDNPLEFLKSYEALLMDYRKKWKDANDRNQHNLRVLTEQLGHLEGEEIKSAAELVNRKQELFQLQMKHGQAEEVANRMQQDLESKEAEVLEMEQKLEKMRQGVDQYRMKMAETAKEYANLPPVSQDEIDEIDRQIVNVEEHNKALRDREKLAEARQEANKSEAKCEGLENAVRNVRDKYTAVLSTADIPVKGLEIKDDMLFLDDLPLSQISKSEGLRRVSIPIGVKMKPGLKAFVIRDGDSMTEDTRAVVREACEKFGVQTILEIAESDEGAVLELMDSVNGNGVVVKGGVAKNT